MTPEQEQKLEEIYQWMLQRKRQQIFFPLDEASRATLRTPTVIGNGSTALTQSVAVSGDPENITVPKAYADTILIEAEGATYEIPIL